MQVKYRISTSEVVRQTGLSAVSLWRKSKTGDFPAPVYIGSKKFWYQDEITKWIEANERTEPLFNNLSKRKQES